MWRTCSHPTSCRQLGRSIIAVGDDIGLISMSSATVIVVTSLFG